MVFKILLYINDFNFYKAPFVFISSALIVGVLVEYNFPSFEMGWVFLCFFGVLTYFFHRFYKYSGIYFFVSTFLMFVSVGIVLLSSVYHAEIKNKFENNYSPDSVYLLEIKDLANSEREWVKVIASVNEVYNHSSVIRCDEQVVLFVHSNKSIQIGDKIVSNSHLEKIRNKGNPGEFDAKFYWKNKGIDRIGFLNDGQFKIIGNQISWYSKLLIQSRNYFLNQLEKHLKGEELALAQALIIGDRSNLDNETINAFGNSGAMHVLAVSGLHIGIILQIILLILKLFSNFISKHKALVIALVFIWLYTFVTGLSASVLRSSVMFSILAISQVFGRNHNSVNSLFFTAFILLIVNPLNLFDIGFQLSFLAMLGIFWFYKPILSFIYIENKWIRKLWETTAVGFAAQLLTVPLTLYYFHQFPNYFILTNLALMLVTGLILGFGMLVYAFSWVHFVGKILVFGLFFSLLFTLKTVHWIDSLPGSVAKGFDFSISIVFCCYFIIVCFYVIKNNTLTKKVLIAISIILLVLITYQRNQNLSLKELHVFNHSKLVFLVKNGSKAYCFYDSENKGFKKAKRLIDDYSKVYPAKVYFFDINNLNRELSTNGLFIKVKDEISSINLTVNHLDVNFIKNINKLNFNTKSHLIYMPWLKHSSAKASYLGEKSFRFSL